MAFPLGLMATMAGREVWLTGDRFMEYGYISDPLVSEVRGWPGTRLEASGYWEGIHIRDWLGPQKAWIYDHLSGF